ncbi:hypothetical protein TNCV_2545631 [Trichonephila clavipes]|nr:hypothetical protein TNCV_2545631 [Trichonephila clavipes]
MEELWNPFVDFFKLNQGVFQKIANHRIRELCAPDVSRRFTPTNAFILPSTHFPERGASSILEFTKRNFANPFWHWYYATIKRHERTATAGSDVVQSGRPIFDDFFQHLWPYIGNNTANVVFQMVKRSWLIRIDQ